MCFLNVFLCSKFLIVLLLHLCVHTWYVSVACMLRTEDSCIELVLSYLYVGSMDRTRVIRFAWQLLYLILSLTSPCIPILSVIYVREGSRTPTDSELLSYAETLCE